MAEGGKIQYNQITITVGPATPGNLTNSGSSNKRNLNLIIPAIMDNNWIIIWGGDFISMATTYILS